MVVLIWDKVVDRVSQSGVDQGVLYPPNDAPGVAWNGLVGVQEKPTGGTITAYYVDGIRHLNSASPEEFQASIEALTYPDEFEGIDGTVYDDFNLGYAHQPRQEFGFSYRTRISNPINPDLGYLIHLVYNAKAEPTERDNRTINESPESLTFTWEVQTRPIFITGHTPTAHVILDSRKLPPGIMDLIQDIIYGTVDTPPRLPHPEELWGLLGGIEMPFLYVPYFYILTAEEEFPDEAVGGDAAYDPDTDEIFINDEPNDQVALYPAMWDLTGGLDFPLEALLGDLGFDGITGDVWRKTDGPETDRLVPATFRGVYTPTESAPYPTSVAPGDGWLINGNIMVWLGTEWHDFGEPSET